MQFLAKFLVLLLAASFAHAQSDVPYGCYEGAEVAPNIQAAVNADLAKWQSMNWLDYEYDFFFVKAGHVYCPVTITVTNGISVAVSAEKPALPDGQACEPNPAGAVLVQQQLTLDVYMNDLIGHAESAYHMCWQPQTDAHGQLFSYMYLSASADQSPDDDSEVYITNVHRLGAPLATEASEASPANGNRRLGPVLRGAVNGAIKGCIAGAIITGSCAHGARVGSRVGATVGLVAGVTRPRMYGPPMSGGMMMVAGGRRGW